jgi:signal transduction histidine kinase
LVFGVDGSVLYRNPAADRLLRRTIDTISDLPPDGLRTLVDQALEQGSPPPVDVAMGQAVTLGVVAVRLSHGRVLLVLQDVTRARRLDAVRSDFVANASHELKTPVASIQALAETIAAASAQDPASVAGFAQQLTRETERLTRIVSDLLDLSRLEGGPAERATIRLDRIAREEAERFIDRASRGGLDLRATCDEALIVIGSERDLRLLVRNLVQNAVQHTGQGGQVDVITRADGSTAILLVRDTGVGIPTRDRGRVFERFYRVDRARSRDTGGTGLGLSIVKHVAENHGGAVEVDSEVGRGSTFTVRLPLADEAETTGILPS